MVAFSLCLKLCREGIEDFARVRKNILEVTSQFSVRNIVYKYTKE